MVYITEDEYAADLRERENDNERQYRLCRRFLLNPVGEPPEHFHQLDWNFAGGDFLGLWRKTLDNGKAFTRSLNLRFGNLETLIPGLPDDLVVFSILPKIEGMLHSNNKLEASQRFRDMGTVRRLSKDWRMLASQTLPWAVFEYMGLLYRKFPPTCRWCRCRCRPCIPEVFAEECWRWSQKCWQLEGIEGFHGLSLFDRVSFAMWLNEINPV